MKMSVSPPRAFQTDTIRRGINFSYFGIKDLGMSTQVD